MPFCQILCMGHISFSVAALLVWVMLLSANHIFLVYRHIKSLDVLLLLSGLWYIMVQYLIRQVDVLLSYGPLAKYIKLRVAHAPCGSCQIAVTYMPWCMPVAGTTFTAFPEHAQPAILRVRGPWDIIYNPFMGLFITLHGLHSSPQE